MNRRLQQAVASFNQSKIDSLLVIYTTNIRYLTEFNAHESWLLVTPKKVFYITDFRYILEAKKGLKSTAEIVQYSQSFYKTFFELAGKYNLKKIGFDSRHVTLNQFQTLSKACPKGVKLIEANNLVENLRDIKDSEEVGKIRVALKLHAQALKLVKKAIRPGVTERSVQNVLDNFIKANKVGYSFDPIIASGPNSCFPHARVSDRIIKNNEPVLVDMGIDYKGYKSDLTRMVFLGKIPRFVYEVNEAVELAQQIAIKNIRDGAPIAQADRLARKQLALKDLEKFFGHALGHGVGLDIHESPRLSQSNPACFKEGMVVTVEPAVYIPHKFGIRIEDMVLVKKTNCEVLSGYIDH